MTPKLAEIRDQLQRDGNCSVVVVADMETRAYAILVPHDCPSPSDEEQDTGVAAWSALNRPTLIILDENATAAERPPSL